jgi:hypothetical protein
MLDGIGAKHQSHTWKQTVDEVRKLPASLFHFANEPLPTTLLLFSVVNANV